MHHYPRRITTFHRSRETLPSAQITLRATFVHILVEIGVPVRGIWGAKRKLLLVELVDCFRI